VLSVSVTGHLLYTMYTGHILPAKVFCIPVLLTLCATSNHTATEIPFMYSFSGNCVASVPISTCICLRTIYIGSWEYVINRLQLHECGNLDCGNLDCGNLDCGRAIPFLGIFVLNFRYWFFAVHLRTQPQILICAVCYITCTTGLLCYTFLEFH
jgi:hypothetical protein